MQQYIKQVLIDPRTGEIIDIDAQLAILYPKRVNGFTGWVAMAQEGLLEILSYYDQLKGEGLRVLLSALAVLDFNNVIEINQSEIAKKINMRASHFNRSWKKLVQLGIILEIPRAGRTKAYRLNPIYGWKGSSTSHKGVLRKGKF